MPREKALTPAGIVHSLYCTLSLGFTRGRREVAPIASLCFNIGQQKVAVWKEGG